MKANFPDLSISDVQDWVGSKSFSRGESYFQRGMILEPRRQWMTLMARCLGSSAPYYLVAITLDEDGILEADCSCPVGAGGHCKHAAALLLTWLDSPDAFEERPDLETALEKRSKSELIALIRQMLGRYPELEYLLELPSPTANSTTITVDPEVIRRQVLHAFSDSDIEWDWQDLHETARDLDELLSLAGQYMEQGSISNAAIIYYTVAEEILQYEDIVMSDQAGRLAGLVDECVEGLRSCLGDIEDTSVRRDILQAIFNVYLWDVKMGGIGIGEGVPEVLLDQATSQEKKLLTGWIQSALDGVRQWGQEILGGLLLDLQADQLDDEEFLEICRQTGRLNDLVDRLLVMGWVDAALSEAANAEDYLLLDLADLFVSHGHVSLAEQLVQERAETSRDVRLLTWLKDYAVRQGKLHEALALAKRIFWMRPALSEYVRMKNLADSLKAWSELRVEVLEKLSKDNQFGLLVQIYLEEGEIDRALETLEQAQASARYSWEYPYSLELQVAKAAEESRPEQAIQLYLKEVNRLIDQRGRGNYAEATAYLIVVRGLHQRLGKQDDWQTLIAALRQDNRKLRAFQDELRKAGL